MTKPKFYYVRKNKTTTTKGTPVATVCLVQTTTGWARGVALCSSLDNVSKHIGRAIAQGRAEKAIKTSEQIKVEGGRGVLHKELESELRAIVGHARFITVATPFATLTAFETKITTPRIKAE